MAVSDKTRKQLWGRSGNRCAICKTKLISDTLENQRVLNIGEEAHIISARTKGPRHRPNRQNGYDDYSNLILLCANHHTTIDELIENYPEEKLIELKKQHEIWVEQAVDREMDSGNNEPTHLRSILSGREIVRIIDDVHFYSFDKDDNLSREESLLIDIFLESLEDWGDLFGMTVVERGQRTEVEFNFDDQIKQLMQNGFMVFGERYHTKVKDFGEAEVAAIRVSRVTNPEIKRVQ